MKTPEDEAFDELARKQGAWGGGFTAKRKAAADKMQEDLTNYGTAWSQDGKRIDPMSVYKEQPAQEQHWNEDEWRRNNWRCGHGWLRGEQCESCNAPQPPSEWAGIKAILDEYGLQAIDFVADFKAVLAQPAQEPAFGWIKQSELARAKLYSGSVNLWLEKHDCDFPLYTAPPQRTWVGLTDEQQEEMYQMTDNIADCRTCYFQGIADAEAAHNIGA